MESSKEEPKAKRHPLLKKSPSQRDTTRKEVDAQIVLVEEQLRQLRTKRNECAPISALSDDILGEIFLECKPAVGNSYRSQRDLSWIGFSHVCRRWRTAAIDYGPLWSTLTAAVGPRWLKEMITRSKQAEISVYLCPVITDGEFEEVHPLLVEALAQTSRLVDVSLHAKGAILDKLLPQLAGNAAPLLRTLTINSDGKSSAQPLAETFLNSGKAPKLQKICLYDCFLPWSSPLFDQASSIRIRWRDQTMKPLATPATTSQLVRRLADLTHLTELDISQPLLGLTLPSAPIQLPHLHRLRLAIGGLEEQSDTLLSHLRIPQSCSLRLLIPNPTEASIDQLGKAIASCWIVPEGTSQEEAAHPFKTFRLEHGQYTKTGRGHTLLPSLTALYGWQEVVGSRLVADASASLHITFVTRTAQASLWTNAHTQALMFAFAFHKIWSYFDVENVSQPPGKWSQALAHFSALQKISISTSKAAASFFNGLTTENLPNLSSITLHKVEMGDEDGGDSLPWALVQQVLTVRQKFKRISKVKEFVFHDCPGSGFYTPLVHVMGEVYIMKGDGKREVFFEDNTIWGDDI